MAKNSHIIMVRITGNLWQTILFTFGGQGHSDDDMRVLSRSKKRLASFPMEEIKQPSRYLFLLTVVTVRST